MLLRHTGQHYDFRNSKAILERVPPVHVEAGLRTMTPKAKIYKNHLARYTAEHFVQEYTNILRKLWDEKLDTDEDLTPEWVVNPIWKQKTNLHPDFQQKNKSELETILMNGKKYEKCKKTVVHGDLCPTNIIFDNNGHAIGLIDLGDLHMGNKMLDVAVLSWTIRGNFGKKYEESFLQNIGIKPNDEELEYYRLIYDLSLPDYKNWNWIKKEEK